MCGYCYKRGQEDKGVRGLRALDWRDRGDCDRARVAVFHRKCGTFQGLENQKEKQGTLSDQVHRLWLSLAGGWELERKHHMLRGGDVDYV